MVPRTIKTNNFLSEMKQVKARLVRKWHLRLLFQTGLAVFDAKLAARLL